MAEAAVGATIQVLLENLLTLSKEQIGLVLSFKDDLEKLQETFSMVKAFLHDAEKKQATGAVKIWLKNLEDLAFEADNVFDEINYGLLSKKAGATTVMKKVKSFFPSSYPRKLGRRIKGINEKLESIHQHASKLGLQNIAAQAPVCASETTQTDSVSEDPIFHGRTEEVSSVVGTLIKTESKLSVLPIVGMGGLGKTTLVRKVFNHEQIKSHFGDKQRVWVHVPRTFDVVVLFEKILTSMGTESHVPQWNREALLKKLQERLDAKKYLLVLDDVWNEDREKWDGFVNSLSGISSAAGNCIIVTTRNLEIASIVNTLPVHELKCLSKDECWSIIQAKAFIGAGDDPSEFKAIGINIAKKCQGLPLAAKVVGGLLRGKPIDEWFSIEKNWLSDYGDDQNPMPRILKLSFDNLPSPSLKKCFAYCSIFPKGYEIEKKQMVELWMAEGFLQTDHMETIGNKFFNFLIHNSLLQVVRRDDHGNITHCNMHDLVHDMSFSILYETDKDTDVIFHSRYIGHKSSGDGFLSIAKGQERYVRTLFFNGKISDIRFSDFESLRTLTFLSKEDIDDLPTSIRKLKHLRYLDISETRIKILPDSIGELYHLQTLRANDNLKKLSDSLSCLVSLRHLQTLRANYNLVEIKLEECSECEELPMLGHLPHLKYLYLDGLTKVTSIRSSFYGNIDNCKRDAIIVLFHALERLVLQNMSNLKEWDEAYLPLPSQVFPRLKYLKVEGCWELTRAPSHFPCLEGLVIDGMESSLPLENICGIKLTSLTRLTIEGIEGLECLPDWLFSNNHNLTKLEIFNCPKMTHLVPLLGGSGAPSLLRELRIWDCPSLRELPDDLHNLSCLEVLEICDCPDMKSIPYPISSGGGQQKQQQQGFTSLRQLKINYCEGLTNLPIEMVESCAKSLEKLELVGLSSIMPPQNLVMVIGCLHKMRDLDIKVECPHFSYTGGIGSLHLRMSPFLDCDNVSFNETVGAMLSQLIFSLRRLSLIGKEHWDSLPDQLQHLTSLEELSLDGFGIEALPEWFGNLSSLKELYLGFCKKLRHLPSKQRLSKLTYLDIIHCPEIDDSQWPNISHIHTVMVDFVRISPDE